MSVLHFKCHLSSLVAPGLTLLANAFFSKEGKNYGSGVLALEKQCIVSTLQVRKLKLTEALIQGHANNKCQDWT